MRRFWGVALVLLICLVGKSESFAVERPPEEPEPQIVTPQILIESGAKLTGKRTLTLEPGLEYSHISTNNLDVTGFSILPTVIIGQIEVEKIRRDVLVPSVAMRFGLSDAFEFNLKIPYVYRIDRFSRGVFPDSVSKRVDENDIGDIEAGVQIHLLNEKGIWPEVLAGFKAKSRTGKDPYGLKTQVLSEGNTIPAELPTGSGHWGLEPSLTFVKTVDPAVVFGTLSYFNHLERDLGGTLRTVDPGDSFNYSFGIAYALNDKLALSSAYEQKFFERTEINGVKIAETDLVIGTLQFGCTYAFAPKTSLSLAVSFGLTPDSPDIQVALKTPIRFRF